MSDPARAASPAASLIALIAVHCVYQPATVLLIFFAGITHECLNRDCGYALVIAPVIGVLALAVASGAGWGAFAICRRWPEPTAGMMRRINLGLTFLLPFILFGMVKWWLHAHPAPLQFSHGPLWG